MPLLRYKISAPIELLSTSNPLSFTAPDIIGTSSSASSNSGDESDRSPTDYLSPLTSAESSSIDEPTSPEPNHLSSYFPVRSSSGATSRRSVSSNEDAPAIPQRAHSHTKSTHQMLARKRSQRQYSSPPNAIHGAHQARSSASMFSADCETPSSSHPFSHELAQVNELAEEYGVNVSEIDAEEQMLRNKGFLKFAASDYLMEIQGLFGGVFEDRLLPMSTAWI
ncbi:MAG: hypothetical protein M1829_000627 [Trizodia sp. TS-e1964]|nr:MAG: hypothetical protein M1829_000627 [Trizodia sp. TS-e1964]